MQLLTDKSNESMSSLTKSIDMASTTSTVSIKAMHVALIRPKKANSLDDEFSSEAISSCSDNDDKLKCHHDDVFDDEQCDTDSSDSMLDNFDVTLVDGGNGYSPKNDAERMFFEVVEVLRYEQEV